MNNAKENIKFLGERFVPGKSGRRIEADHLERYRFLGPYVKNNKVLDIACGVGFGSRLIMEAGASQYVGVDISEESIQYAKQQFRSENVSFIAGDVCSFKSIKSFDVVICFETIEHVSCYRSALNNLFSVLSPCGVLIISSPNRLITSPKALHLADKPVNKFHTQEFTPNELVNELIATGFYVSEDEIFGQRQRWLYSNKHIQSMIRLTRFPDIFAFIMSPKLTPVKHLTPRYFIVVGRKESSHLIG